MNEQLFLDFMLELKIEIHVYDHIWHAHFSFEDTASL